MTKHSYYWFGDHKCTTYYKHVGHGYEVGFFFGKTQVFVGNFIHKKEASKWWSMLNKEVKAFTKRYSVGETASVAWYSKFIQSHLYKTYYAWLDHEFSKYHRTYAKSFARDEKKYRTIKHKWTHDEKLHLVRAA